MKYIYITDEGIYKTDHLTFPNWDHTAFIIDTVAQEYLAFEDWVKEDSSPEWEEIAKQNIS